MNSSYPIIRLKKRRNPRIEAGHLWVFSNELEDGFQQLEPGQLAELHDGNGRFLAMGTVNPHSLIAFRVFSRQQVPIDESFLRQRIGDALSLRTRLLGNDLLACRLVFSEADGLPGLIVDRYDDLVVLQSTTAGIDTLLPQIVTIIDEILHPASIISANDTPIRELEGLSLSRVVSRGEFSGVKRITLDGIELLIDPLNGQKTGFFLDQRLNRRLLQTFVRPGDSVLDLFCYTGAIGAYALKAQAGSVTFVDASESALIIARDVVTRNGWMARANFIEADIFPWIKEHDKRYNVVILDPPALAKSRRRVPEVLRAYRDLNARAMKRVRDGGILATASCSGLIQVESWRECLREAASKANRRLRIIAEGGQPPDHPVLLAMPETRYLKFAVAVVDRGP